MTTALDSAALAALGGEVERVGLAGGLDAVGIADATPFARARRTLEERKAAGLHAGMQFTYRDPVRSTEPSRALPGARSLVVGARSYRRRSPSPLPAPAPPGPRGAVARYSWVDHYALLREALEGISELLRRHGFAARVLADDNALVDREAAFRAGLGWYGRNTMLLLHGRGSEFVLGAVITDAALPAADAPGDAEATSAAGCGSCTRCLPACPTGALRAGVLDANRCLAWLLQADGVFPRDHRVALGGRIYGCDDCQDACPPNRLEIRRRAPAAAEADAEPAVDLLYLLEEDDDEALVRRHERWYIARRDARYLRRNALVALGNVGDGDDARTAAALGRHLAPDRDPLVRAHAVWAAARLGRTDLLGTVRAGDDDPDGLVAAELGALPPPR